MADNSVIGALRYILSADTAQLEAATGRASKSLRSAAAAGEAAGAAIGNALANVGGIIAGAFAVDRIVSFATESVKAAAAIAKFSDQAGLTARQFQGLEFALRDAHVPQEQLAQGFAIFSRNLSDLQRNTGPFLDFLRRYAPAQIAAFRASNDTAEGFSTLVRFVNSLGNQYDRVRVLTAAGAEQFGRLNNVIRQGPNAINENARAFQGLSDEAIKRAQEIERRWDDMMRRLRLAFQEAIVGAGDPDPGQKFEQVSRRLGELEEQLADRSANAMRRRFEKQAEYNDLIKEQIRLLGQAYAEADRQAQLPPPKPQTGGQEGGLGGDRIKAAQDQLTLFMAKLNQLPSQANLVSGAFQEAWARMDAAMAATGASEAARAAARIGLIQQESAARTQALGNAMMADEQLARRGEELQLRRNQGIITETEYRRALNLARSEYQMAQLTELQSLGVTLSANEQFALSLERIKNAYDTGKIGAEGFARANERAAYTAQAAYSSAASVIATNLSQAFSKSKLLASAAALINTYVAYNKTLAEYGGTPWGWAAAASVLISGFAQVAAINSTGPGGGVAPSASVPSGPTAPEQQTPSQSLTISLPAGRYTHDEVMAIIEGINDRVQNGATLISTKVAA